MISKRKCIFNVKAGTFLFGLRRTASMSFNFYNFPREKGHKDSIRFIFVGQGNGHSEKYIMEFPRYFESGAFESKVRTFFRLKETNVPLPIEVKPCTHHSLTFLRSFMFKNLYFNH